MLNVRMAEELGTQRKNVAEEHDTRPLRAAEEHGTRERRRASATAQMIHAFED